MTIRHDESVKVWFVRSYKTKYLANVRISMPWESVRLGIVNKLSKAQPLLGGLGKTPITSGKH